MRNQPFPKLRTVEIEKLLFIDCLDQVHGRPADLVRAPFFGEVWVLSNSTCGFLYERLETFISDGQAFGAMLVQCQSDNRIKGLDAIRIERIELRDRRLRLFAGGLQEQMLPLLARRNIVGLLIVRP